MGNFSIFGKRKTSIGTIMPLRLDLVNDLEPNKPVAANIKLRQQHKDPNKQKQPHKITSPNAYSAGHSNVNLPVVELKNGEWVRGEQ